MLGSADSWSGGEVGPRLTCVLAPNPGPMTLDGTNTWLVGSRGGPIVVVDPGPAHGEHLRGVVDAAEGRIAEILLTHGHPDHAEGARSLHEMTRAPVRALDPAHVLGGEGLHPGDTVDAGGLEIRVVATPGHTRDCLTFHVPVDGAILTGDTVLGRGTTVVAWPDGHLADYLDSLAALRRLAEETGSVSLLPGHGPVLGDPAGVIDAYLDHRRARLEQVRIAVQEGATTPEDVVDAVYGDVPTSVRWAALLSTRAQLEYLAAQRDGTGD